MPIEITIDGVKEISPEILNEWLNTKIDSLIGGRDIKIEIDCIRCENIAEMNEKEIQEKEIFNNFFSTIEILPNCIKLNCMFMGLTTLPALPVCEHLNCDSNILSVLPQLNVGIKILYCDNNLLTALPKLPVCTVLYCSYNNLNCVKNY